MDRTSLFKDVTTDLNQCYREVVMYYQQGDTKVGYLREFELFLSQCCPDKQLWNFPAYRSLPRLPENTRTKISSGHFLNCLIVYEQIMREVGLIDKDPMNIENERMDIPIMSMGAD